MFPAAIFARIAIPSAIIAIAGCAGNPARSASDVSHDLADVMVAEIAAARNDPAGAARYYAPVAARSISLELLERAARLAAQGQQPRLALSAAERWVALAPGSADAQALAGAAAMELYRIREAGMHFTRVALLQSAGLEAGLARVAEVLSESDDVHAARRVAELVAAPYPDSGAALQLLASARFDADDASAAVPVLRHAWNLARLPQTGWMLSRALAAAGLERESLELADRLADAGPAGRLQQAGVLLLLRHDGAAQAVLESLLDASGTGTGTGAGTDADALLALAELYLQRGDLDAAEGCLLRLVKSAHHLDEAFFDLGRIAERRGEDEVALRLYARVNEGNRAMGAMLRAATLLRRRGFVSQAEELLDGLAADVPTRAPQIIAAKAQLYADTGDADQAVVLVEAGLAGYPDSTVLQFKRAELLDDAHRLRASLRALEDLRRHRPDDPAALNALGYTLADHGIELSRARRLVERALAQAPQSAAIRDSLGWVLFRQGHAAQALPYLESAFAADRGAQTGAHLGEVLWVLDRRQEAREVWARAGLDDPRDPVLQETLRRLGADASR